MVFTGGRLGTNPTTRRMRDTQQGTNTQVSMSSYQYTSDLISHQIYLIITIILYYIIVLGTQGPLRAPNFIRSTVRVDHEPELCTDYKVRNKPTNQTNTIISSITINQPSYPLISSYYDPFHLVFWLLKSVN